MGERESQEQAPERCDYVIILGKSSGSMRHHYVTLDSHSRRLAPKVNVVCWSRLLDLVDFATCVYRKCLYVIGGREKSSGRCTRAVRQYDPDCGRWRRVGELTKARARHCAVEAYGKIYVFGR